MKLKTTTWYN